MSGFDIFSWIVRSPVRVPVAVFCIAGRMPGHIAQPRTSLGTGRHGRRLGTLICGFAFWPVALIWAYVDIPGRKRRRGHDDCPDCRVPDAAVRSCGPTSSFNLLEVVAPYRASLLNLGLFIPMGWARRGGLLGVPQLGLIVPMSPVK